MPEHHHPNQLVSLLEYIGVIRANKGRTLNFSFAAYSSSYLGSASYWSGMVLVLPEILGSLVFGPNYLSCGWLFPWSTLSLNMALTICAPALYTFPHTHTHKTDRICTAHLEPIIHTSVWLLCAHVCRPRHMCVCVLWTAGCTVNSHHRCSSKTHSPCWVLRDF